MKYPFILTSCIGFAQGSLAAPFLKGWIVTRGRIGWVVKQSEWEKRNINNPMSGTEGYSTIILEKIPRGGDQGDEKDPVNEKSNEDLNQDSVTSDLSDYDDSEMEEFLSGDEETVLGETLEEEEEVHVNIIPFDDDVGESVAENSPEVQIIPFDDDVGEFPLDVGQEGNAIPSKKGMNETQTAQIQAFDDNNTESFIDSNTIDVVPLNDGENSEDSDEIEITPPEKNGHESDDQVDVIESLDNISNGDSYHEALTDHETSYPQNEDGQESDIQDREQPRSAAILEVGQNTEKELEPNIHEYDDGSLSQGATIMEDIEENEDSTNEEPVYAINDFKSVSETSDLFRRIWGLLKEWEENDSNQSEEENDESRRLLHLIHEKVHEYVSELLEFERCCFVSLTNDESLPKAAPHPKKVLRYIAPKLHAISHSPDIMLRIRSAHAVDVGAAATAIGVVAAIMDLYEEMEKYVAGACDKGQRHGFSYQNVRDDVIKDRRFEQLLECVSCGIDVRRRTKEYESLIHSMNGADIDGDRGEDGHDKVEDISEDTEVFDDDERLTESISASDIARLIFGITAMGFEKERVIDTFDTTDYIVALGIRANEILQDRFQHDHDPDVKSSLSRDVAACTVAFSAAGEFFSARLQFVILTCLKLFGANMRMSPPEERESSNEDEDLVADDSQIDEIVDRLAMSEEIAVHPVSNDPNLNRTKSGANDEISDLLLNYLCRKDRMAVLKALTVYQVSDELKISNAVSILLDIAIAEMMNDVRVIQSSMQDYTDEVIGIDCVDAAIILSSTARDHEKDNLLDVSEDIGLVTNDSLLESSVVGFEKDIKDNVERISPFQPIDFESFASKNISSLQVCISLSHSRLELKRDEFRISLGMVADSLLSEVSSRGFTLPPYFAVGTLIKERIRPNVKDDPVFSHQLNTRSDKKSKVTLLTSLQDVCIIMRIASEMLSDEDVVPILEACLVLMETEGYDGLYRLDNFDIVNFIHGSALVLSNLSLSQTAGEKLSSFIIYSLKREFALMTSGDLFRLIWSIASIISTQSSPFIKKMVTEGAVQELIDHGLVRMKTEINSASITELSTVPWSFAECYMSQTGMSLLDHFETFELLGECMGAASSIVGESWGTVEFSAACKLAFASSFLNLGAPEFMNKLLYIYQKNPNLISNVNNSDLVRLLYSISRSESKRHLGEHGSCEALIRNIVDRVSRSTPAQGLTPDNFTLFVWSLGQIFPLGSSKLLFEIPVYAREQLCILSPQKTAQLVSTI